MKAQDLKTQMFQTASQWQSGLLVRLEALEPAGITLFSRPQFVRWLRTFAPGAERADSLALDECRQIYWIDGVSGWLYRFELKNAQQERMLRMGDYTSHSGRMVLNDRTLWLVDRSQQRVLAFSREHLQLQYVIEHGAVDLAFDGGQYLYVLEKNHAGAFYLSKYDVNGLRATEAVFQPEFHDPQGVAAGKASQLYVIDTDAHGSKGFHRIAGDSSQWIAFPKELQSLAPTLIAIDARGNIFVVATEAMPTAHADGDTEEPSPLHQFSPDGSYLGQVNIPNSVRSIHSIAFDARNAVYLGTEQGIAYLDVQTNSVGQTGVYYSRTLDSGAKQGQWHRLRLQANLPPGTSIEVQYYASDEEALQSGIDCLLSNPSIGQQEKEHRITRWLGSRWSVAEAFTGSAKADETSSGGSGATENNPPSSPQTLHLLFQQHVGRYLWLKLALSTFNEQYKPAVSEMQVYSPRLSYLRFLPAIYQEDAVSSAFLEKFLALFETVLHGLDTEIHQTFRYFDPEVVPREFLDWLSTWLNFALQEEWPEARTRRLLSRAHTLFKGKGTLAGLAELIEIYTGQRPRIVEDSRLAKPMLLVTSPHDFGDRVFRLGVNSIVKRAPVRGFRLGDDAILGKTAVRDIVQEPEESLVQDAHRFTVFLNLPQATFTSLEPGLRRLLSAYIPAHTEYRLRLLGALDTGAGIYIEMNSELTDYRPFRVGIDSTLGRTVAVMHQPEGVLLERNARLTRGMKLL